MIAELLVAAMMLQGPPATKRSELKFEHDGLNTTRYEVCVDALPCTTIATTNTATTYFSPFPAVTPGQHTATVRACNPDICSDPSNQIEFKFVALPNAPSGLTIVIK
jgi:hypothetical protein